ncbi:Fujikurins efflux protein [Lachnellula subtilissima]|uniref:Fujikurins efflux protein n=1 Tax=Lachnellula subtilissima TaxID=602034 RepID=A0A8H8UHF4_9HELO|nr:Fujikurins efflux protein [Lachnellula subtilissima]
MPSSIELQNWNQVTTQSQTELVSVPSYIQHERNSTQARETTTIPHLKRTDGGLAAWGLLAAAFVFEACFWGFPISYGVFQNYYSTLPAFAGSSKIALIGTIAQGFCYLGAPLSTAIAKRFPKFQRLQIWIGWPLCILSLVAGSFAETLNGLIATQGVMYGLGFVMLTYPIYSFVDEWFVVRKGMAFGIVSAASGFAGMFVPFIVEVLLHKYGYKTTLRAIAIAMAVLTAPLIPFLKGRLPPADQSTRTKTNWGFVKKPLFWIYGASTLIQNFGFFFPALYLPLYATAIGLSATKGALILAVMAGAQVLGQFSFGYLSDKRVSVNTLAITSSVISTFTTFVLWGMAKSLAMLVAFAIMYGFFGYGFSTMRVAMARKVSDDPSAVVAIFSILVFLQGIGNILAGPISTALLSQRTRLGAYGILKYQFLVVFTGICMAISALTIVSWYLRPRKTKLLDGIKV